MLVKCYSTWWRRRPMLKWGIHSWEAIPCCRNKKLRRANPPLQSCFWREQPGTEHGPFYLQICKLLTDNEQVDTTSIEGSHSWVGNRSAKKQPHFLSTITSPITTHSPITSPNSLPSAPPRYILHKEQGFSNLARIWPYYPVFKYACSAACIQGC